MNHKKARAIVKEMEKRRSYLLQLWGAERYGKSMETLVTALRTVAEKTGRQPFKVALDEAIRAGEEGREAVSWQLTAAACEIAEGAQ